MRAGKRVAVATILLCGGLVGAAGPLGTSTARAGEDLAYSYVALGDSYSSGQGNPWFEEGTHQDYPENHCHRSNVAYPELFRNYLDENLPDLADYDFRACSGAKVKNMWEGQYTEGPQLDALSWDTDVVTLTIGGNDLGFAKILTECAKGFGAQLGAPCQKELRDDFKADLERLRPKLHKLYEEIKFRTNNKASVFVLGYPQIFPVNKTEDCPWRLRGYVQSEVDWIRSITHQANDRIQLIAAKAGVHFVPVEYSFAGHTLCTKKSYANGIVALHGGDYSFHPNSHGHYQLWVELINSRPDPLNMPDNPLPDHFHGDFEYPDRGSELTELGTGEYFDQWMVGRGNVDHKGTYWEAASGVHSVDLNGCTDGLIYQTIRTEPGEYYAIVFALAGNPEGGPDSKEMQLGWGPEADGPFAPAYTKDYTFDSSKTTNADMGWSYKSAPPQLATSRKTTISFASLNIGGCYGPVVDDISVERTDPVH